MSTRLINKAATRKFILAIANERYSQDMEDKYTDSSGKVWNYSRCGKNLKQFTSVSVDFIDELDRDFRKMLDKKIQSMQLRGKTVR